MPTYRIADTGGTFFIEKRKLILGFIPVWTCDRSIHHPTLDGAIRWIKDRSDQQQILVRSDVEIHDLL